MLKSRNSLRFFDWNIYFMSTSLRTTANQMNYYMEMGGHLQNQTWQEVKAL